MSIGIRAGVSNDGYLQINGVDMIGMTTAGITLNGQLSGNGIVPTGAFQQFMLPSAPSGWIVGDGSTIGSPSSGATFASNDALNLFTAWWAYSDAQLPIFTSGGTASTRGASASADWAANKRLTVFDVRQRFVRNAGGGYSNGTKYASTIMDHQHMESIGYDSNNEYFWGDAGSNPIWGSTVVTGTKRSLGASLTFVDNQPSRIANTSNVGNWTLYTGNSPTGESAPNSIAMLGCFKL